MSEIIQTGGGGAQAALPAILVRLLAEQLHRLTRGESTSVPAQTAEEVLSSLCFILGLNEDPAGDNRRALLAAPDKSAWLDDRVAALRRRVRSARRLFLAVRDLLPGPRCRALADTMRSLDAFGRAYDPRFAAHLVPCDMDYQLVEMPPEHLQGVDYVHAWLRALLMETDLLRRFPETAVTAALHRLSPDWRAELMGLYSPVADMALGLCLLGEDPRPLCITPAQQAALCHMLARNDESTLRQRLAGASAGCCAALGVQQRETAAYLGRYAETVALRLAVGETRGVFHL